MACRLRMIFTNDVYDLKNYPRLKRAINQLKDENTVTIMAGDFLAPCLLTSLDNGVGVVEVMNATGFDYACFGNHECDVHQDELLKRIDQSKFTWINSNMQSMTMDGRKALPEYVIKTITNGDVKKRIGFLGLLSNDPHLYRPGSYGGATIEPIISTYERLAKQLDDEGVDLIVPITHQSMKGDRDLAKQHSNIPVILGGHDHEYFHETVNGCQIVKTGMDIEYFDVVDVEWSANSNFTVNVTKHTSADYEPDTDVVAVVEKNEKLLESMNNAALCYLPTDVCITSQGIRTKQTNVGTLLVSAMRDCFLADCAMFNSGGIRANKDYPVDQEIFTYADLESEMPFDNEIVCVRMPGKVFSEIIKYSRQGAYQNPPEESGGFMQVDDGVTWCSEKQEITHIGNNPIRPDYMYDVVCVELHLKGIDNIEPMLAYAKSNPGLIPEDGIPVKQVLVRYFSRCIWMHIGSFRFIDKDDDNRISREELKAAASKKLNITNALDFVLDKWFQETDEDNDGEISPAEMCTAVLHTSFTMFDTNHDGVLEKDEIKHFMERTLGRTVTQHAVDDMLKTFDKEHKGVITRDAVRRKAMDEHSLST
eukprot:CFRG0832T1